MYKILWLTGKSGISSKMQIALHGLLKQVDLNANFIVFDNIYRSHPNPFTVKNRKRILKEEVKEPLTKTLNELIDVYNPTIIVCQDEAICELISKSPSLENTRGSVYTHNNLKVIMLLKFNALYQRNYGRFVFLNDFAKLSRWIHGKVRQEPKFSYQVIRNIQEAKAAESLLEKCMLISEDIETYGPHISCIGFSGLHEGRVYTFVFPLIDPQIKGLCYWAQSDEIIIWQILKRICGNPVPKVFQNGNYDNAYLFKHGVVNMNYLLDTYSIFHATYQELPKSLNFIASICLDNHKFWKDEAKGEEDQAGINKHEQIGKTKEEIEQYWRYNALDCYNTIMAARYLLFVLAQQPHALFNYSILFNLARGPAFYSTMHGFAVSDQEQLDMVNKLEKESAEALRKLRLMVGEPDFNPKSPQQLSNLFYKVLDAPDKYAKKANRNKKTDSLSTDKRILKIISEIHPFYKLFVDAINAYKEPENNISKYAKANKPFKRLYWGANAAGTEMFRQSSRQHHFRTGTNAQNIPDTMRGMFVSDPGYFVFDADYSQSDFYFVACESGDEEMIRVALSPEDTHCIHAAHFFSRSYDEIMEGMARKDPFFAHKVTGIRALTKRISHGANYMMAGYTLYMTMGREQVVAAAIATGNVNANLWDERRLVQFCEELLASYFIKYPRLREWQAEQSAVCRAGGGLVKISSGMTRKFFGDPNDQNIVRKVVSLYGQAGTASNINRCLFDWFFSEKIDRSKLKLFLQVHDSLVGKVRMDSLQEMKNLLTLMEEPVTINGRTIVVPAEATIGFKWRGSNQIDWHPEITVEEIIQNANRENVNWLHVNEDGSYAINENSQELTIASIGDLQIDLTHG
jgi:DNA polymerase I-like protein with 3'-5' exonuclease and polymerase domains